MLVGCDPAEPFAIDPASADHIFGLINIPASTQPFNIIENSRSSGVLASERRGGGDLPILRAKRISWFNPKNRSTPIETRTIKISFHRTTIPHKLNWIIVLEKMNIKQCTTCARLGHTKKWCKSPQQCLRCRYGYH